MNLTIDLESLAASPVENSVTPDQIRGLPLVSVGDCYDFLGRMGAETIDAVVTSPPYWGLRSYGHEHNDELSAEWAHETGAPLNPDLIPPYDWYRQHHGVLGLEPFPSWYVQHLVEIFARLSVPLKQGGNLWVNLGDTFFARWSSIRTEGRQGLGPSERTRRRTPTTGYLRDKQLLLVPSRFAIAMQEAGWILRNDVIWSKPAVAPRPERDRLRSSHEHFFHFVKRSKVGRPSYYYDISEAEPNMLDVVTTPSARGRDKHSATFPADLIRPRIRTSCPPGGLVVDPFCGTGRTLEVAIQEGRQAYGIELSEQFAASARRHVKRARRLLSEAGDCDDRA